MVQELGDVKAVTWAPPSDSSTVASGDDLALKKQHSKHHGDRVKSKRAIGDYNLTLTLGSGGMGKVKLAVHQNDSHKKLAVKIIRRRGSKDDDEFREERTLREANILSLLHHPYIVNLKAPIIVDDHYYYLMMEYVSGGQLLDYIISHGKLKEKHARRFARQIMSALDYCHRNSIVHRDLKIENILISRTGHVKIIDFGLSNLFSPDTPLSTFCGSLYFAAPELLNGKSYNGPAADVWSFGIVLYVLVCGKVPFDDQTTQTLHEKIKKGAIEYPPHLTLECKSLLNKVLVTNPGHRSTVSEIMVHPWMLRGYDGPVDNHLPPRQPLTLPIDMAIVRRMTVFTKFGTEEEIKEQLEKIITSEQFQEATRLRNQRSASHSRNGSTSSTGSGFFSLLGNSSSNSNHVSSYPVAKDDPQSIPDAYHPLVSVYHLVKERMEREDGADNVVVENDFNNTRRPSYCALPPGDAAVAAAAAAAHATKFEESGPRKHHHQKSASLASATLLPPAPPPALKPAAQKRNGRGHKKAKSYAPIISPADNEPKPSTSSEIHQHVISRKLSTLFSRTNHANGSSGETSTTINNNSNNSSNSNSTTTNEVNADEHVRPVFLKGLFSMTTTSTKSPAVIRNDLTHVLKDMSIDWCETQGRFECTEQQQSVCFEIHIVKVPWLLGMHGLQFRRISGNSWEYKNICSSILTALKL
ncbi:kinase-like domain-containing protein [Zychaea mexicana]|uniref:kinase-like domain-containing protein n=1 Tax=Zychaea mexicana TaxID=64656 RepID=UPI0022FE7095|nr:kinase-like domain-containing protein [Zychaea mexicana]KAI9497229.1 kinase-like domain-containing protein [Zychaea mexicana]